MNRDDGIAQLCPELRAVLDAELAAGNSIAEIAEAWGLGVLLALPFRLTHAVSERVTFRPVNDPHYWLAEYTCAEPRQFIACRFP